MWKRIVKWWYLLPALFLLPTKAGGGSEPVDVIHKPGLQELGNILRSQGVPEDAIKFLQVIAGRESGGNVDVGLGPNDHPGRPPWLKKSRASSSAQDNEARAARAAYNRMEGEGTNFPGPPERWQFGSVGYFGNLIPYSRRHIKLEDPWDLARVSGSVAEGVANLRGLMNHTGFKQNPTWSALYAGWGGPGRMSDPQAIMKRRKFFIDRLRKLGMDTDFADQRPGPRNQIPSGKSIYAALKGQS